MGAGRLGGASFHSMPARTFTSHNPMVYSGPRFNSGGFRSPSSTTFRSHPIVSNPGGSLAGRQLVSGNVGHNSNFRRFANGRNQSLANQPRNGANQFRNGANQVRNGNQRLRPDWQKHVFAQRSGNWHRDWDRHSDHWWNGHRCHFFNGSWVIFDIGFYPWWPWWDPYDYYGYYPYGYGYGGYGYGGYGYGYGYDQPYGYDYGYGYGNGYDSGAYDPGTDNGGSYDDQNGYGQSNPPDQSASSEVAAVQDRLTQKGYYHGKIDGVLGPETRHAIVRFQSSRGLRVSGELTSETLDGLGLRQYARY